MTPRAPPLRKNRRRRWIILGVATALLAVVLLFQSFTLLPVLAWTAELVAPRFGFQLTIESLTGSVFSELEVKGLSLSGSDPEVGLRSVECQGVDLVFAPWPALTQTEDWPEWFRGARVEQATIEVEVQDGEPMQWPAAPESLPPVVVEQLALSVTGPDLQLMIPQLSLSVGNRGGERQQELRLDAQIEAFDSGDLQAADTRVALALSYHESVVEITRLDVGEFDDVAQATFDLSGMDQGNIEGSASLQIPQAGVQAKFDLRDGAVDLQGNATVADIGDLARRLGLVGLDLVGVLNSEISGRLPFDDPAQGAAAVSLVLTGATIQGIDLERLTASIDLEDGQIVCRELEAVDGANRVTIEDVTTPLKPPDDYSEAITRRGIVKLQLGALDDVLRKLGVDAGLPAGTPLEAQLIVERGILKADAGSVVLPGTRVSVNSVTVDLTGGLTSWQSAPVDARLQVVAGDLASTTRLFDVQDVSGSASGEIHLTGTLAEIKADANLQGSSFQFGGMPPIDFSLACLADLAKVEVRSLRLDAPGTHVIAAGTIEYATGEVTGGRLAGHTDDIAPLLPAGAGVKGPVDLRLAVSGPLTAPVVSGQGESRSLVIGDLEIRDIETVLELTRNGVRVSPLSARVDRYPVEVTGAVRWSDPNTTVSIDLDRLHTQLLNQPASLRRPTKLRLISGGSLQSDAIELSLLGGELSLEPTTVAAGGDLEVRGTATGLRVDSTTMGLSEEWRSGPVNLDSLTARLEHGRWSGELSANTAGWQFQDYPTARATLRCTLRDDILRFEELRLASGDSARFEITGEVSLLQSDVPQLDPDAELELNAVLSLEDLTTLAPAVAGSCRARFTLRGTGSAPVLAFDLDSENLKIAPDSEELNLAALSVRVKGSYAGDSLSSEISVASADADIDADFSWQLSPLREDGQLLTPSLDQPINLSARFFVQDLIPLAPSMPAFPHSKLPISGSLQVFGEMQNPLVSLVLWSNGLDIGLPDAAAIQRQFDLTIEASHEAGVVRLDSLTLENPGGSLSSALVWNLGRDLLPWLADGAPLAGSVEGKLDLLVPDIGAQLEGKDIARRASGRVAAHLKMSGEATAPDLEGEVVFEKIGFRPAMVGPPTLSDLSGSLRWIPGDFRSVDLRGSLGYSPFVLDGTWDVEGGDLHLDLSLRGDELLLFRGNGLRCRADTHLALTGTLSAPHLSGRLDLADSVMVKNVDLLSPLANASSAIDLPPGIQLFHFDEPPLSNLTFDVEITARSPFRVRNNVFSGAIRPDLKLLGTGRVPYLTGVTYVDKSKLYLPSGTVYISAGVIRFLSSNPFVPVFEVNGEMHLYGYDIGILLTETLVEPEIHLSSVPPLMHDDLLLLVLTGKLPDEALTGTAAIGNVATYVGKDMISRFFSDESTERESIFERLEIEYGRDFTREGEQTIVARYQLQEGIGKRNGKLYLEGEKDAYDDFNMGFKLVFRFR